MAQWLHSAIEKTGLKALTITPNHSLPFSVLNPLSSQLTTSPSPLIANAWALLLAGYSTIKRNDILSTLCSGALIGYEGEPQLRLSKNLASAAQAPDTIMSKLHQDLLLRRVIRTMPTFLLISSPLGLVPKHDGGWRRIHFLSFPDDALSVNGNIPDEYSTIEYITVD